MSVERTPGVPIEGSQARLEEAMLMNRADNLKRKARDLEIKADDLGREAYVAYQKGVTALFFEQDSLTGDELLTRYLALLGNVSHNTNLLHVFDRMMQVGKELKPGTPIIAGEYGKEVFIIPVDDKGKNVGTILPRLRMSDEDDGESYRLAWNILAGSDSVFIDQLSAVGVRRVSDRLSLEYLSKSARNNNSNYEQFVGIKSFERIGEMDTAEMMRKKLKEDLQWFFKEIFSRNANASLNSDIQANLEVLQVLDNMAYQEIIEMAKLYAAKGLYQNATWHVARSVYAQEKKEENDEQSDLAIHLSISGSEFAEYYARFVKEGEELIAARLAAEVET